MKPYAGLSRLGLLQLGDIHFPDVRDRIDMDDKDPGVPRAIATACSPKPLKRALDKALLVCEDDVVDSVVLCGDLTSYGDASGYVQCVQYITASGLIDTRTQDQVHVVPGNHDVDRDKCDKTGANVLEKFRSLRKAWSDSGMPILTDRWRATNVSNVKGNSARVFSVNSCIGCGVLRSFPDKILRHLELAIKQAEKKGDMKELFRLKGETLDCPGFHEEDISEACEQMGSLPREVLSVFVTHHNVLPQAKNRVAAFAELLNAGLVRSRLSTCNGPVLYLHGHIHDAPVEVVVNQANGEGCLVCISAPALTEGFNVIFVEYGKRCIPMGCIIVPYRRQSDGSLAASRQQRLPLQRRPYSLDICDKNIPKVIHKLTTSASTDFNTVLREARTALGRTTLRSVALADMLLEAEWAGFVQITNNLSYTGNRGKYRSFEFWDIKRLV